MLRLIVRHTDTSNMTPHGGTHITTFKTFDIAVPEVERLIRDNGQHYQHQVVGVELLPEQAVAAARADGELPEELFDGDAVYRALTDEERSHIAATEVADVLDAVVRLIRTRGVAPAAPWPEGAHFTDMEGRHFDERGEPLRAAGVAGPGHQVFSTSGTDDAKGGRG
jgi:hypothetical protein